MEIQGADERAAIAVHGASVALDGAPVLEELELSIKEPERVAIIGPSGAGKTTLLRLIAGDVKASSGSVQVLGQDLRALSHRDERAFKAQVGWIHQSYALVPSLRVVQNVAAGRLAGRGTLAGLRSVFLPKAKEAEEIYAVLERVGIEELLYRRTDRLSGGEQQRVAIARTLYQGARLLLADEPVASVDPARAREIIRRLVELAQEEAIPLVASLHDVDLAFGHFTRVVGLRAGRIVFDQAAEEGVNSAALGELYSATESSTRTP